MKTKMIHSVAVLTVGILLGTAPERGFAAEGEGVAVAIVYDTSGSMGQSVRDSSGKMTPKHVIAKRALEAVVKRLQAFATNPATSQRPLEVALFVFSGANARAVIPLGRFRPDDVAAWTSNLPAPSAGTPLGTALRTASDALLRSTLPRKHVLVITDGANTQGPEPVKVLPAIRDRAASRQTTLSTHFVAFDVDARVFNPLKKLGVTVVGAADETQLNTQLSFILEKKILLEDEELPVAKPKTN